MTTEQTIELREGDRVRVLRGQHWNKIGTIEHIGHSTEIPLYLVKLDAFGRTLVFLRDELERVESEVHNG